jgi:hypothetical protein
VTSYALRIPVVASAVKELRGLNAHRNLPGYLCVIRAAGQNPGSENFPKPSFNRFHEEFFRVDGGPAGKPYLIPFNTGGASGYDCWLQTNTEGSYSVSSYNPGRTVARLFEQTGRGREIRVRLLADHATTALDLLLHNKRVPALSLAIFLYRNHEFSRPDVTPDDLTSQFRQDFGFMRDGSVSPDYAILFTDESGLSEVGQLVEEI